MNPFKRYTKISIFVITLCIVTLFAIIYYNSQHLYIKPYHLSNRNNYGPILTPEIIRNVHIDQCKTLESVAPIFSPNKIYSLVTMNCKYTQQQGEQHCSSINSESDCSTDQDYQKLILTNGKGENLFDWTFDFNHLSNDGNPLTFIDDANILLEKNNSVTNGQLVLEQFNISSKKNSKLYSYNNLGKQVSGLIIVSQNNISLIVEPQSDNGYLPQRLSINRTTKEVTPLPQYTSSDDGYWSSYSIWGYSYKQPKKYSGPFTTDSGNGVWVHTVGNGGFEMHNITEVGVKNSLSFMVATSSSQPNCLETFETENHLSGYHFKHSCSSTLKPSQDAYIFKTAAKDFAYLEVVTDTSQIPEAPLMIKSLKKQ